MSKLKKARLDKAKKRQMGVGLLLVALVVVLGGSVLFVGAVAGWFDNTRVALDTESICEGGCEMVDIDGEEYESMVNNERSFVLFVDQGGCKTADRLREYVTSWAKELGVRVYRIMFSEAKETSLYSAVKYYPSVVVVSKGKPVGWLKADSDEDAAAYNYEVDFREWILQYYSSS